ncbi:MAG: hypothetical protein ACERLG_00715 [Sedimentibacter sp.]
MEKRLTRGQAIRAKCLDCSNGSPKEVRECPVKSCALYRYRLGTEEHDILFKETVLKQK